VLPDGARNTVRARLPLAAAFVCIKAITLGERMKEKDAYDIYFCVEHHPGGYAGLAGEFAGKLGDPLMAEGVAVLRDKFAREDGIGPVWAGKVAAEAGGAEAAERRRAFELVNALLLQIGP
jgi:hypothetical protein